MRLPDNFRPIESPSNNDPGAALDQIQILAAMNGIALKGIIVSGPTREGIFYEPSWKWWNRLEGTYSISKESTNFLPTNKPKDLPSNDVLPKLAFVTKDLTNLGLGDLENGYDKLKRTLQRTNSDRDTWLALMKSLPYVIISLFVALYATSVQSLVTGELAIGTEATFASIIAIIVFSGLFAVSYFKLKTKDGFIATLGIYCEKVQTVITERRNRITRKFGRLVLKPLLNPVQHNVTIEDMARSNKAMVYELRNSFGKDLSKDVQYAFPPAFKNLSALSEDSMEYADSLDLFVVKTKDLIQETSKTSRFGVPSPATVSDMTKATYLVASGIIKSESDFEHEKRRGLNDHAHFVQEFLSLKSDESGYAFMATNKDTIVMAQDCESKFVIYSESYSNLKDIVGFIFEQL